jgi:hypothetical protein
MPTAMITIKRMTAAPAAAALMMVPVMFFEEALAVDVGRADPLATLSVTDDVPDDAEPPDVREADPPAAPAETDTGGGLGFGRPSLSGINEKMLS